MQDRPNFVELLEAARHFLDTEVVPRQVDHRARFRTLVTINALTILEREAEQEGALVRDEAARLTELLGKDLRLSEGLDQLAPVVLELNGELARLIRRGSPPHGTLAHLRHVVAGKLKVASPRYLERHELTAASA